MALGLAKISYIWHKNTNYKKMDKLDFIKINTFALQKTQKWKGEPRVGREYLQNMSKKGLVTRIHEELLQLNKKTT